jgi:REP element-mobilizing transposase RayT
VTICTRGRECIFAEAVGNDVRLSLEGTIVAGCWIEIPRHFPRVALDLWVVMPNHVHGIIRLEGRGEAFGEPTVLHSQSTTPNASPLRILKPHGTARGSLGAIIQNYKAVSSRRINCVRGVTGLSIWQRSYHEHVIRGDEDLTRVRKYIIENPERWELDEENPTYRTEDPEAAKRSR